MIILSDLESRGAQSYSPVHVINLDIQDNHEEATLGAFLICEMCQAVSIKSVETVELYSVDEGGETWKVKQYPDIKRVRCHNFSLTISAPVQTIFVEKSCIAFNVIPFWEWLFPASFNQSLYYIFLKDFLW